MIVEISIIVVVLSTVIGATGAIFLKKGAVKLSRDNLMTILDWHLILGGTLYILALPPYLFALQNLSLSVAYPLTSTTYIWSALFSQKHLKEDVHKMKWVGIGFIILGIALIAK
ncbi:EamA family transporter [Candidatus Woesearchaeota archaeon]|nr:EamA family transporter [Candidatus Woesearchaeota archaeon]